MTYYTLLLGWSKKRSSLRMLESQGKSIATTQAAVRKAKVYTSKFVCAAIVDLKSSILYDSCSVLALAYAYGILKLSAEHSCFTCNLKLLAMHVL